MTVEKRRICIDEYSVARGSPKIYVVGDCALVYDLKTGQPLPPSAHIALEQADIVAKNIYGEISGTLRSKYKPKHVGEVVSLGGYDGVGELWGLKLAGCLAILAKMMNHLQYIWSIGG